MWSNYKSLTYLLIWFAFIFICAFLTPYFANDYRYLLIQGTDDLVTSFYDIVISQYRHYFEWGGRTVAHVIAQTLLWIGKIPQAFIQAVTYIILVLFIYYNGKGIKPTLKNLNTKTLFFITIILWLCLRYYGEVVFNVVSSANYLYTTTLILIFVLPYRLSFVSKERYGLLFSLLMFILGLLSGWCNENTSAALALVLGMYGLYTLKIKQVRLWMITGYVGLVLGLALLVFAPGNEARLDFMEDKGFDFVAHLPTAINIFFLSLLTQLPLLLAFIFVLYKVHVLCLQYSNENEYKASWFLFALGFFALFLMIFSPNFPARSATPFTIFIIAATISFASILQRRGYLFISKKAFNIFVVLASFYCSITFANTIYGYYVAREDNLKREIQILNQVKDQNIDVKVDPFRVKSNKYLYISDVRQATNYWTNLLVAKFYKIKTISRTCDIEKSNISLDFLPFAYVGKPVCADKSEIVER